MRSHLLHLTRSPTPVVSAQSPDIIIKNVNANVVRKLVALSGNVRDDNL